jgi:hypothetical protein
MKSVGLQICRAIRLTGVLGAAAGVLLFLVVLFSKINFGRILGVVIDRWRPIGLHGSC